MQDGTQCFLAKRAAGAWYGSVQNTLKLVDDPAALKRINITVPQGSLVMAEEEEPQWLRLEKVKLAEFWTLATEIASARSWSQTQFVMCQPHGFAASLHPDEQLANACLREQRRVWECVLIAERAVGPHSELSAGQKQALTSLLQELAWNRIQISREVYLTAQESAWNAGDARIREQAKLLFSGQGNTKFDLEDVFAHLSQVARSSNSNTPMNKPLVFGSLERWLINETLQPNVFP